MAEPGDIALEDGMDIVDPTLVDARDIGAWINRALDYIAGRARKIHQHVRADITDLPDVAAVNSADAGKLARYNADGQLPSYPPTLPAHVATKAYVDGRPIPQPQLTDGGTFLRADQKNLGTTGDLFASGTAILGSLSPVTNGWRQMYINSDGRVGVAASGRQFKKDIRDHAYGLDDALAIRIRSYRLRAALFGSTDAPVEVGVIAQELVEAGLSEYVYFDDDGTPTSVHYERLALVALGALQDLAGRHADLEARIARLEARHADN